MSSKDERADADLFRARMAFFSYRHRHFGAHSGYGRLVQHMRRRFRDSEAVVVTGGRDGRTNRWRMLARLRDGVIRRICGFGIGGFTYSWTHLRADVALFRHCRRNRVHVVHSVDAEHGCFLTPRLCRRGVRIGRSRMKTVFVGTFHQPPDVLRGLVTRATVRSFDEIVVLAPNQVSFFRESFPEARINLVPHGVDVDFFRPAEDRVRSRVRRCLVVGSWLRDLEMLRRIVYGLRECSDVEFVVVSGGKEIDESYGNVRTLNGISDRDLLELYQTADILLLPLKDCTANNALLEGMACGLPIVCTDLAATRYYAPQEGAVFLGGESGAAVQQVAELLSNPERCRAMGKRNRARALELRWENVVERVVSIYRAVCGEACLGRLSTDGAAPPWGGVA